MGGWHRENPELAGTDRDPWMGHPGHRAAAQEVTLIQGCTLTRDEVEARGVDYCDCGHAAASHRSAR